MNGLRKYVYDNHWTLGLIEKELEASDLSGGMNNIKWIDNPFRDRWFADPFILEVTPIYIYILVEEFYDPISRGRISKLTINRSTYKVENVEVVLELPSHLSFPAIIRGDKGVYIYPENSTNGNLSLYKYDLDSNKVSFEKVLCNEPLTDAIVVNFWDEPLVFSTHIPTQNGNILYVYKEKNDLFLKKSNILFNRNVARNAGDWFLLDNNIYRPAQDCTFRYGGGIVFQTVEKKGDDFIFQDVGRLSLTYKSYKLGCHTFNHYKGVSVIDVNGYRRPWLANTVKSLTTLKKKILGL